jgi:hypothetical protein
MRFATYIYDTLLEQMGVVYVVLLVPFYLFSVDRVSKRETINLESVSFTYIHDL